MGEGGNSWDVSVGDVYDGAGGRWGDGRVVWRS